MEERLFRAVCNECGAEANQSSEGEKCGCGGTFELVEYYINDSTEKEYDIEGKEADQAEEIYDNEGHPEDEKE